MINDEDENLNNPFSFFPAKHFSSLSIRTNYMNNYEINKTESQSSLKSPKDQIGRVKKQVRMISPPMSERSERSVTNISNSLEDLDLDEIEQDANNYSSLSHSPPQSINKRNSKSFSYSPPSILKGNSRKSSSSVYSSRKFTNNDLVTNPGEKLGKKAVMYNERENLVTIKALNEQNAKTKIVMGTSSGAKTVKSTYVEDVQNMMSSSLESSSVKNSFSNRSFYNLIKKKYENDYGLKENQFETIKSCFDRLGKKDDYINKYILKQYICDQIKERARVVIASEKDVNRAIEAIDSDGDGKIDFNEYLVFLYLFFAKRQNVRRRIVNVLNGQSLTHTNKGKLSESEIVGFVRFLKLFYGTKGDLHLSKARNLDEMTYKEFANWIFPIIKDRVFVK